MSGKLAYREQPPLRVLDSSDSSISTLTVKEQPRDYADASAFAAVHVSAPRSYTAKPNGYFSLHNRRYVGSKHKLLPWIFSIIQQECSGASFADIFAGTGVVAAEASRYYRQLTLNDFLHSNNVIYKAFFGGATDWDESKIRRVIDQYNSVSAADVAENYFSANFGGRYFSRDDAKIIGFIREQLEVSKTELNEREYHILLASLLYSADKIANTVGHYDAYFKNDATRRAFRLHPIAPIDFADVDIFQEDANKLAQQIQPDIAYIDPPYNSRQYSRFYHVLETLTKWDKPALRGVALKPPPENMSDYCRIAAKHKLAQLVSDLKAGYLVVSYNNTYKSKSSSSQNKITLDEIWEILRTKGETKAFQTSYRHFNAGNTDFNDHREYLFVTKTSHASRQ